MNEVARGELSQAEKLAYAESLKAEQAEKFKQRKAAKAEFALADAGAKTTLRDLSRPGGKVVPIKRDVLMVASPKEEPKAKTIEQAIAEGVAAEIKAKGAKPPMTGVGEGFTHRDAEEEPRARYQSKGDEKASARADLSLRGRAYDRERPMLEKTIAALQTLGIHFSYDLFRRRWHVGDHVLKEQFGDSTDNAILVLRTHITEKLGFDPRGHTEAAVFRLCLEHAFNPVLDYLDGLKWDGKPRLDTWLMTYLGATEGALNRVFGRKVLIAAARRARIPGTKFDQMMVLEGEQDTGKSSAVKILAGDFFRDEEIVSKSNKEVQELTCGVWLYEMSELVGLTKRDVEHVKNFLSRTHDSARGAWGRKLEDQARTCVFIGTCNRSDYLSDDTGNRRFWPVSTGEIDLDALKRDRDQLWAEANIAEQAGEELTIDRKLRDEAAILADSRLADDPWDQRLAEVERMAVQIDGKFSREFGEMRASSDWLLRDVLDINPNVIGMAHSKRLAASMRRLGWKGPKNLKINSHPDLKGYTRSLEALHDWR
jgi:Virulence-associated protein E